MTDAFARTAADKHDMLFDAPTREARIARMEIAFRSAGQEHFGPTLYAWIMYAQALKQRLKDEGVDTKLPAPPYADGRAAGVLGLARVWAARLDQPGDLDAQLRAAILGGLVHPADRYFDLLNEDLETVLTPAGKALLDLGRMLNARAAAPTQPAPAEA